MFCDGPAEPRVVPLCDEVRRFARSIAGFRSLRVIERDCNLGLSASIISGVTELCEMYGRAIVLEDDVVVSRHFLAYMNDALDCYEEDDEVISIGAYMFPVNCVLPETFFFRVTDCWGWGVWKRAWDLFQPDGRKLLAEIERRNLRGEFDLGGAYDYSGMLEAQTRGQNDSWAIRWYATALLSGRLTLYPGRSLTENIGCDDSGTHGSLPEKFAVRPSESPVRVERHASVHEDLKAKSAIADFLRGGTRRSWLKRIRRRISGSFS